MSDSQQIWALIVAAGRGTRAGGGGPKQYRLLGGVPLLRRTVGVFLAHPRITGVCVVIRPDDEADYRTALADYLPHPKLADPVPGGAQRQASVLAGLAALDGRAGLVLIHDAARPFVDPAAIGAVIAALETHEGAILAAPVQDTLKSADVDGRVLATVPRDGLWRAQTPQGFRFAPLLAAHRAAAGLTLTDDAAVAERAGMTTVIVPSDDRNFKLTTPADFALAKRLLAAPAPAALRRRTAMGTGFDVHRLAPGDGVMLCGVAIRCPYRLIGHSDADAGLHALTDAVLGALGDGDIGDHFPPTDDKWRGAPSDLFLAHAAGLVRARGGRINHLDVTLICEHPKIKPHREAMRARIAAIAGVGLAQVSVKATTTEGLGFTGRGEGIAAQAAATLSLPTTEEET